MQKVLLIVMLLWISISLFLVLWTFLLYSIITSPDQIPLHVANHHAPVDSASAISPPATTNSGSVGVDVKSLHSHMRLKSPARRATTETLLEPPSLDEIRANLTIYLHTLHANLKALAGPHVDAIDVWDEYLRTTKELVMTWDDQNRHRFPKPRSGKHSLLISLCLCADYCHC